MTDTPDKTRRFLQLVTTAIEDVLDCDGCLELLPEFVELILAESPIPPELICVRIHLCQCDCCHEEYEVIVASLARFEPEQ